MGSCCDVFVDGEAATMRNLEADYPKETVPMVDSLSGNSFQFHCGISNSK